MVDVDKWVGVLLGHQLELVLEGGVMITGDQANMGECANLLRALAAPFFVPLEEVAKLRVVLPLLLLDRHDVLERLAEVLQMQVQVLLVCGELANLFCEDAYVAVLEVLSEHTNTRMIKIRE